ncbi:MAG: HAD-IB family phosphatase [Euryarchaeota archaeon]|nr:HAD-IB family phosphatase [Euryarchaeota archaeon]
MRFEFYLNMEPQWGLIAFDMDGVLVDYTSSWTWVHDHFKIDNEATLIDYIEGRIDDREFMRRDIGKWIKIKADIHRSDIERILEPVPIINGISETVKELHRHGAKAVIVSGGLDMTARRIAKNHGFDGYLANGLECDPKGMLTGEGVLRVDLTNKGKALRYFQDIYGVEETRTVAIGNSFVDVSMFSASGLSIAFNPIDDHVQKNADVVMHAHDLREVLGPIMEEANCRNHVGL